MDVREQYLLLLLLLLIFIIIIVILTTNAGIPSNNSVAIISTDNHLSIEPINDDLGMFNISVKKSPQGYSGLIRGCTWNICRTENTQPIFSYPYYINLDNEGKIVDLHRIDLDYEDFVNCRKTSIYPNGIEDPRLFIFKDEEWAIANCLGSSKQEYPCSNAMCIFKLNNPRETFKILTPPEGVGLKQVQKNWSPFEWNGKLLCEYTLEPHDIVEVDIDTGLSTFLFTSGEESTDIIKEHSLRGGAPPILIDTPGGKTFLSVGHTRIPKKGYVHFFYTFDPEPPFAITHISSLFKLENNDNIQFVTGLSIDSNDDPMIHISYGIDDCHNQITKYPLSRVLLELNY